MLDWINVFKVNRKIKSRLWPWIKIILSIILFFAVFYGDIYVHILDKTKTGRIVEALIVPRTYTIYYRRGSRRLTFGVRTRTTGNPLEMGGREYFIGPTGKREQIVKDLDTLMKEVKKYARFDKVLVQAINGEPVKK